MKTITLKHKDKKGNIKESQYVPVNVRLKEFYENEAYKDWTINTEIIEFGEVVLMKATIKKTNII